MHALVVRSGVMTGSALDRLNVLRVWDFRGIETLVASDAVQRRMDRLSQDILANVELDHLPMLPDAQVGLAVAGEAVLV